MIANEISPKQGIFTAFNKLIVTDAGSVLPSTVGASTVYSLCFDKYGKQLKHRFKGGGDGNRMTSSQIAREMGIRSIRCQMPLVSKETGELVVDDRGAVVTKNHEFDAGWVAAQAMKAIKRFCSSDRSEPSRKDVVVPKEAKRHEEIEKVYEKAGDEIASYLAVIWADLNEENGRLPVEHGVYVKLAELDGIQLFGHFIMVDEAQDLSPVMISIIRQQKHMQVIAVGDNAPLALRSIH